LTRIAIAEDAAVLPQDRINAALSGALSSCRSTAANRSATKGVPIARMTCDCRYNSLGGAVGSSDS